MKKMIAAAAAVFLFTGCIAVKRIAGSGRVESRSFDMKDFSGVHVSGPMHTRIEYGPEFAVRIELDDNLFDFLDVHTFDGTLFVALKKSGFSIGPYKKYEVSITMPALESAVTAGSGHTEITGFADKNGSLFIGCSGSGNSTADVIMKTLTVTVAGSGSIRLRGETGRLNYQGLGSGKLRASSLKTAEAEIVCRGSGGAEVYTEKLLDLTVNGSGSVSAEGSAETLRAVSKGSGKIRAFNLKADNVFVHLSGSGGAEVYAEKSITAECSGSGNLVYRGHPSVINVRQRGSGSIRVAE